jgi:hypothetical protein
MTKRILVACVACESVYTARTQADGKPIVATEDGACACGNRAFDRVRDDDLDGLGADGDPSRSGRPST